MNSVKPPLGDLGVFYFSEWAQNFYHAYLTIRKRAGDRTIYLDKLKEKLMDKMEDADNRKLKRH